MHLRTTFDSILVKKNQYFNAINNMLWLSLGFLRDIWARWVGSVEIWVAEVTNYMGVS